MVIGGLQKSSLIDYPGKISCVIFLSGCNFQCPYCHNLEFVKTDLLRGPHQSEKDVLEFLKRRKGVLEGVVISGGEPTLQEDLNFLCEKVKELGFPVKLDTNGSHPSVIRSLLEDRLVDYIAMDIKTDPSRYESILSKKCNPESILQSIRTIMKSSADYEFRTTCVKPFIDERIIEDIAKSIKGGNRYVLQRFNDQKVLNPEYFEKVGSSFDEYELLHLKSVAEPWVNQCIIR